MKYEAGMDEELTTALRALAHPVRLSILRILAEYGVNDCCCTDVTDNLPLAQSTVSQHIKVLLDAGLIERRAHGTRNCYFLRADKLEKTAATLGIFVEALANTVPSKRELSHSA